MDLVSGTATGQGSDVLSGIEDLTGSEADVLVGDDGPNHFVGGGSSGPYGNDTLMGSDGDDVLQTGEQNDDVSGGDGDDLLIVLRFGEDAVSGDGGVDTVRFGPGPIAVDLAAGTASDIPATSTTTLATIENVFGTSYDDVIVGDSGPNTLLGLFGNDQISGLEGDDTLNGGTGTDDLDGGQGMDTCTRGETVENCEQ